MARRTQDAIDAFVNITGASAAIALRMLEENGGDLNQAINAHFSEGDIFTNPLPLRTPSNNVMYTDDPFNGLTRTDSPLCQHLTAISLLDSAFQRNFFSDIGNYGPSTFGPWVSQPRGIKQVPTEFKDDNTTHGSALGPRIDDIIGSQLARGSGPEIRGTIISEDDTPTAPGNHISSASANASTGQYPGPFISTVIDDGDYYNEVEEEMIRAAIEFSKLVAEHNSASKERGPHEQGVYIGKDSIAPSVMYGHARTIALSGRQGFSSARTEASHQAEFLLEEQPLIRNHSRHISSVKWVTEETVRVSYPQPDMQIQTAQLQCNGHTFQTDELGGISSEEHDEAVMLEGAMFGAIPEGAGYRYACPRHQDMETGSYRNLSRYLRLPRSPSPTPIAQRMLKEQQDDEYLATLLADQEKELMSKQETERLNLEENAWKEATLVKQKLEEEENHRKQLEEVELERKIAAKEVSLPDEPSSDDENAVTLLVRLPDGSRRGRRFLKTDKLQLLFDYIDIGRVAKPGSYRLVRPYPRCAFTNEQSGMSLKELGLNIKQESLFLELI